VYNVSYVALEQEKLMILRADAELCCGSGQCAELAPAVFGLDEDGLVVLLDPEPAGADLVAAGKAIRDCPTRALSRH
jgi:ferredoxin